MTWVKLDDNFPGNRKVVDLDADAFRLYVEGLCYCGQNHTDGVVTGGALRRLWHPGKAAELVKAGLWLVHPDGYEVKDFLKYNPSRAQVEAEREKAAERKERWRERRRNAVPNGVQNAAPTRPDPTRRVEVGESVETPPPVDNEAPVGGDERRAQVTHIQAARKAVQ